MLSDPVIPSRLALRALDQALVLLANEEGNHVVSTRETCEEQADRKSLTVIDRAKIFQRWEASRWQEKHGRQQSRSSVKRKLDEWADLLLHIVFVPQKSHTVRKTKWLVHWVVFLAGWALLLFPSLASKLGSEILPGTLYIDLPPVAFLYLVDFFVPVLFTSVLPCSMSHTPNMYLIGGTECQGFYAYPTVWLLNSVLYSNWPWLWIFRLPHDFLLNSPIIVHGVISSLTMQWTFISIYLNFSSQTKSLGNPCLHHAYCMLNCWNVWSSFQLANKHSRQSAKIQIGSVDLQNY